MIVSGIIFFLYFSGILLSLYGNTTDFCILIGLLQLYSFCQLVPTILMGPLRFNIYKSISSAEVILTIPL